jgi:dipeptidyl aminopeptidase/acylaminoacyl peptidase
MNFRLFKETLMAASVLATLSGPAAALGDEANGPLGNGVYQEPSEVLKALVDQAPPPVFGLSPDQRTVMLLQRAALPSISEMSRPSVGLGGLLVDPARRREADYSFGVGLSFLDVSSGEATPVPGVEGALIDGISWSPDSRRLLLIRATPDSCEPMLVDVATGNASRLSLGPLNSLPTEPCSWMPDSRTLLCLVQEFPGPGPKGDQTPKGPMVEETLGRLAPARSYANLLKNREDEALFDHYFTSRLVLVSLDGRSRDLGLTGIFLRAEASPSGRFLLLDRVIRPYSYRVPMSRFGRLTEVLDLETGTLTELWRCGPTEEVPITVASVREGRRGFQWRADLADTLLWVEALDGGDASRPATHRDRLFSLGAPFDGAPAEFATLERRFGGVLFGSFGALLSEWWWDDRSARVWLRDPTGATRKLFDYSFEDAYRDPGRPLILADDRGRSLVQTEDNRYIFLQGDGASDQGNRPFLDRYDLQDGSTKRLFHSTGPVYEQPLALLPGGKLLISSETPQIPPNLLLQAADGSRTALTSVPAPALPGPISKEILRYKRADGVDLSGTLYFPAGKGPKDGPFPTVLWVYPQEFLSADSAGQLRSSPHTFIQTPWFSPLFLLQLGYAVLDDPTFPIVAKGEGKPNDDYLAQLKGCAEAAVETLTSRGYARRGGLAVGGHSYGAFTTVNLLTHTDLFATGVARSGAYNRTLTPFGFQSEDRSFWEAPEVYTNMSPFTFADKLKRPLLLIHGGDDDNAGTHRLQSERLFAALKGLGGTARLVLLPRERHSYKARESVLHMLWEMERWLGLYLPTKAGAGKKKP